VNDQAPGHSAGLNQSSRKGGRVRTSGSEEWLVYRTALRTPRRGREKEKEKPDPKNGKKQFLAKSGVCGEDFLKKNQLLWDSLQSGEE